MGSGVPVALPAAPLTPTIGRVLDQQRVQAALGAARLVTLLGPGGVGKTRLATDVARSLAERHARGAVVVELARVTDHAGVVSTIADALDLRLAADAGGSSLEPIGALDVLLVLDNCEHVIDAVAGLASRLLAGGDALRVLATSREALQCDGEHLVALAPLDTSGDDAPALELFRQRAAAAAVATLDPTLAATVVARLDGLPLALEMAAARLRTMTLTELAASIEHDIGSLQSSRRDVDERHRTMSSLLAWSEGLLDRDSRAALFAFAAFAGPVRACDLPAAIDGDRPIEVIARLVDRSLVVAAPGPRGMTFRALETVRSHGRERLRAAGAETGARRRHAQWFLAVVRDVDALVRGAQEAEGLARFEETFDEVRAALRWALDDDVELAAALVDAAYVAARIVLRAEVVSWAATVMTRLPAGSPWCARTAATLAGGLATTGELTEAVRLADVALAEVAGTPWALRALEGRLDAAIYQGRLDDARRIGGEMTELALAVDDAIYADFGVIGVALAMVYSGECSDALLLLDRGPRSTSPSMGAWFEYVRGEALLDTLPSAALDHLERALAVATEVGDRYLTEVSLLSASSVRARGGDPTAAVDQFIALLDHFGIGGDPAHCVTTLRNVVTLFSRLGLWVDAAELVGFVADHPASPTYGLEADRLADAAAQARAALGAAAFDRAAAAGRARTLDATVGAAAGVLRSWGAGSTADRPQGPDGSAAGPLEAGTAELVAEGDGWRLTFAGRTARVRGVKGLGDLATLISRKGSEVHAIELMGATDVAGAPGAQLDDRARREYQRRIVELQRDIDEAHGFNDPARAERAELELDALVQELSASVGLGGRARAAGSSAERARSAVTNRIRAAIRKVTEVHPELGNHLRRSVRTGTWCAYEPEWAPQWTIEP